MRFQHSSDTTISIDSLYANDQTPQSSYDRAAVIFKGNALQGLDQAMVHYGEHKSALIGSTMDLSRFRDPYVVGAGPTGKDPMNAATGLHMSKISGDLQVAPAGFRYNGVVTPTHLDLPQGFGGASMPGDSGGPVFGIPISGGRPVVMGISQSAALSTVDGFAMSPYDDMPAFFYDNINSHANNFSGGNPGEFFTQIFQQGAQLESYNDSPFVGSLMKFEQ